MAVLWHMGANSRILQLERTSDWWLMTKVQEVMKAVGENYSVEVKTI